MTKEQLTSKLKQHPDQSEFLIDFLARKNMLGNKVEQYVTKHAYGFEDALDKYDLMVKHYDSIVLAVYIKI